MPPSRGLPDLDRNFSYALLSGKAGLSPRPPDTTSALAPILKPVVPARWAPVRLSAHSSAAGGREASLTGSQSPALEELSLEHHQ